MHAVFRFLALAVLTAASFASTAATPSCVVEPFQGASSPAGAVVNMRVTNAGASCSITNYGVPAEKKNPADSGSITSKPTHGSAKFLAPQVMYTPDPGFVGDDEFSYEAFAKGGNNQLLRLKVRVKVKVRGP